MGSASSKVIRSALGAEYEEHSPEEYDEEEEQGKERFNIQQGMDKNNAKPKEVKEQKDDEEDSPSPTTTKRGFFKSKTDRIAFAFTGLAEKPALLLGEQGNGFLNGRIGIVS